MSLSSHPPELPKSRSSLKELKPFSKIKLVALDLDGTLLSHANDEPTEDIGQLIRSLQHASKANRVRLTLATGRTLKGTNRVLTNLDLTNHEQKEPSLVLVLYNGSLVVDTEIKAIIYHKEISSPVVKKILNISNLNKADSFIYTVDSSNIIAAEAYKSLEESEFVYYIGASPMPKLEFNGMPVIAWQMDANKPATALLLQSGSKTNSNSLIKELEKINEISVTSSGGEYIEIRPNGSSKANGLKQWAISPNVSYKKEEILAVGDNDNDVELLNWVGIGVAVQESSKAALVACDYVTKYGATEGVIEVLNLLSQAKRYQNII